MVGVGEALLDGITGKHFDVFRGQKAVQRDGHGGGGVVGLAGVAAGAGVFRGVKRDARGQKFGGEGLRPGVVRAGIAGQVLVEIAPGQGVVALRVLRRHVGKQQPRLFGGDAAVAGVGGEVYVVQAQRRPVCKRQTADGVAAVEVGKPRKAVFQRQAAAHGFVHPRPRQREDAGQGAADGLVEGIKEVGRIVIDGEAG